MLLFFIFTVTTTVAPSTSHAPTTKAATTPAGDVEELTSKHTLPIKLQRCQQTPINSGS